MEKDFETYLTGEMQGAARADFEKKLAADPALRQVLDDERRMLDAFQFLRIRQQVATAMHANRRIRRGRVFGLTFLILGATGLAAWHFFKNKNEGQNNPPEIFQPKNDPAKTPGTDFQNTRPEPISPQNFAPKPAQKTGPTPQANQKPTGKTRNQYALALEFHRLPGGFGSTRGVGDADLPTSNFEKALAEFEIGEFKNCVSQLKNLENNAPEEIGPLRMLRAHAYFLDGQTGLAERDFAVLAEKKDSVFQANAEWHRLLCHLANRPDDRTGTQKLLNLILENEEHPFFGQAKKLAAVLKL